MINLKKLKLDSFAALGAQGLAFICSVIMTLIIPKILGVESFGYWQLFIFYSSYVSYFQIGMVDGIYLHNGGKFRDEIDGSFINAQFKFFLSYQVIFSLIILILTFITVSDADRLYVLMAESVYLVISNVCYFWGYLLQAINETRKFSYSLMLDRLAFLIPLFLCSALKVDNFRVYVALFLSARFISLIYILYNVKELLRTHPKKMSSILRRSLLEMKSGLILSTANICSMLILGCARFVIDGRWGIEEFGQLSLSLSMVNFAITFITQISMVLFPAVRQLEKNDAKLFFSKIRLVSLGLLPLGYLLFYPLRGFIVAWLPQYSSAAQYLLYLVPICVLEAQVNLVYITYYKVYNKQLELLFINLFALAIGASGSFVGAFVFESMELTVAFSLAGILARYIVSDLVFAKDLKLGHSISFAMSILLAVSFVIIGSAFSTFLSCVITVVFLVIYYATFINQAGIRTYIEGGGDQ